MRAQAFAGGERKLAELEVTGSNPVEDTISERGENPVENAELKSTELTLYFLIHLLSGDYCRENLAGAISFENPGAFK